MPSDTFQTAVYFAAAIGRFLIVDYDAKAKPGCYVAVTRDDAGRISVQRYKGQPHFGVVRMLETYAEWCRQWEIEFPV